MRDFWYDAIVPMAVICGLVVVALAFIIGFGAASVAYSCAGYEKATGKPTKFVNLDCYIKDGDQWFVWAEYKNRLVTKGSMDRAAAISEGEKKE
jgi:hypothetical protein